MRNYRYVHTEGRVAFVVVAAAVALGGCAGLTGNAGDPLPSEPAATESADERASVEVVAVPTMGDDAVVSAGGYVSDVIELGGTCTFTLTQGEDTVIGESVAEPDATTTWCANVELALPRTGEPWELELRYESPMSVGTGTATSEGELS